MHFAGKQLTCYGSNLFVQYRSINVIAFIQRQVRNSNVKNSVLIHRYRFTEVGNLVLFCSHVLFLNMAVYQCCILMILIHVKYMIGRRFQHFLSFSKDYCLKYVYKLGNISHTHTLAVFIENIQRNSGHQSVSHGILLVQESRICARLYGKPGSPLIHNQSNMLIRVIFIHDSSMTLNQLVHVQSLIHGFIPNSIVKFCCASLNFPSFRMNIIMKRKTVHKAMEFWLTVAEAS